MTDKELDEILQKYAESTRNSKEVAFKKLNEKPVPERKHTKKFKPQHIFAVAVCVVVLVLTITLPLTLVNKSSGNSLTYFDNSELTYKGVENVSILKNEYNINAYYPMSKEISADLISSKNNILRGATINYVFTGNYLTLIELSIIPNNCRIKTYEKFFELNSKQQWKEYEIRSYKEYNEKNRTYDYKVYFTDGTYDYFVTGNTTSDIDATELLDILYA